MSDNDEATPAPEVEQAPSVEPQFDPMKADLSELRDKLERGIYAGESETAPVAEPDTTEPEPVAEQETQPEPEAETPPVAESPETPEPPSIEVLMARLEEYEARQKHMESVLGRETGASGYWRQQAERLQRQLSERLADRGQQDEGGFEPRRPEPEPVERGVDPMSRYVVQLAAERAVESFTRSRPDLAQNGSVDPEFGQIVLRLKPELERVVQQHADPVAVAAHVQSILGSAASEYDVVVRRRNREAIEKRSADQAAELKKRKLASAVASTGAKPARAKPAAADPMTMPIDELRKRLERAYGPR